MYSSLVPPPPREQPGQPAPTPVGKPALPGHVSAQAPVQIASDIAKKGVARLAGLEASVMEDNEATVAELLERIDQTIARDSP